MTNIATSYVLLAPWNYNDYDVSMESRNSVLLNTEGNWVVEEAVKPAQCIPHTPPPLEYHDVMGWTDDGKPIPTEALDYAQMLCKSGKVD